MSYNETMRHSSNYPTMSQSDWDDAPFNQSDNPEREIEVTISLTISKTVKVSVRDYTVDEHEIDYSTCDLEKAVDEQIVLPHEISCFIGTKHEKEAIEDSKDWIVDEKIVTL